MLDHSINTRWGKIVWHVSEMPGCCGVSVIHDLSFYDVNDKYKLYDCLYNTIIFGKKDIHFSSSVDPWSDDVIRMGPYYNVNKYILTDALYSGNLKDRKPTVYEFCHYIGARYGTVTSNPNSGNNVQVFELTRPRGKYNQHNQEYVPQTKGVQTPDISIS